MRQWRGISRPSGGHGWFISLVMGRLTSALPIERTGIQAPRHPWYHPTNRAYRAQSSSKSWRLPMRHVCITGEERKAGPKSQPVEESVVRTIMEIWPGPFSCDRNLHQQRRARSAGEAFRARTRTGDRYHAEARPRTRIWVYLGQDQRRLDIALRLGLRLKHRGLK
jgi:hypothetical protein